MKKQITRISVHQTSKMIAILYGIMGFIALPLLMIPWHGQDGGKGVSLFILMVPIAHAVFGYLLAAVGCFFYNLVAKTFGGMEFVLIDESERPALSAEIR